MERTPGGVARRARGLGDPKPSSRDAAVPLLRALTRAARGWLGCWASSLATTNQMDLARLRVKAAIDERKVDNRPTSL